MSKIIWRNLLTQNRIRNKCVRRKSNWTRSQTVDWGILRWRASRCCPPNWSRNRFWTARTRPRCPRCQDRRTTNFKARL